MRKCVLVLMLAGAFLAPAAAIHAQNPETPEEAKKKEDRKKLVEATNTADVKGDSAWMMVSTAFVMLMVPGLALFYGGMVRRKNVLATMMHSMVALAVVGVYWFAIGYSLAFGKPLIILSEESGSILGFSRELVFLQGIQPYDKLPFTNIPIFLHMLFQGMFAIITPALISGAVAERIRFLPYTIFMILWVTIVYCPLAHCVWALDWWTGAETAGTSAVGYLGKMGALDFAGGTVVHIAAGFSSLAAILVLRRRLGYPGLTIHPNSMVLTLVGAGLLWFGWFGFNGGSAVASGALATSAFAATQVAAAAAGLSWMLIEWAHRGKPTALGLASGIVAGLVAVTPAAGYIYPVGGMIIGLIAGVVCYISVVCLKPLLGYDDSLDAFGVHGVGGFLGAILTGVFCNSWTFADVSVNVGADSGAEQIMKQFKAAAISAVLAFVVSLILVKLLDILLGFTTDERGEIDGLDRTEHGESGFDFGLALDAIGTTNVEPKSAAIPRNGQRHFDVIVEGAPLKELLQAWSDLCQPDGTVAPEFKAVYPFVTTVQGNRFHFRGGEPNQMRDNLQKLFQQRLKGPVQAKVEP